MPVGSVGKWLVLGTLVAALGAGGCKESSEDDGTPDTGTGTPEGGTGTGTDASTGGSDSGTRDASTGPADAGMDAGPVMCGTPAMVCTTHLINPALPATPAGCAKNAMDAEVCGLSSMALLMGADPKFIEKNAPGVDSPSCGAFLDSVEPMLDASVIPDGGGKGNGVFDTQTTVLGIIPVLLKYPGCCTPRGYCSVNGAKGMSSSMNADYMPSDNGYGCVESTYQFNAPAAAALRMIPCDPDSGMILLGGDGGADGGGDSGASDAGADGGNG